MQTEIRQTAPTGPEDWAKNAVPFGRLGEPRELANVIAFLLGDESSFVSGSVYVADGMYISIACSLTQTLIKSYSTSGAWTAGY